MRRVVLIPGEEGEEVRDGMQVGVRCQGGEEKEVASDGIRIGQGGIWEANYGVKEVEYGIEVG